MKTAKWVLDQIYEEGQRLQEIRDGYIEAKRTGKHAGRRIRPEHAKAYAHDFHERADALFVMHDWLEKELDKDGNSG